VQAEFAPADNRGKLSATTEVITFNSLSVHRTGQPATRSCCRGCGEGPAVWNYKLLGHSCDCFEPRVRSCRVFPTSVHKGKTIILVLFARCFPKWKRCATPRARSCVVHNCRKNYFEPTSFTVLKFYAGKARTWKTEKGRRIQIEV